MSEDQGAAEKAIDKATEKICIERWQWTIAKVIAAMTVITAISHLGEAVGEVVQLWPW